MAEITSDAGVVVDAGHTLEVEIQILPFAERRNSAAHKLSRGFHALAVEIGAETVNHVLNDSESMVHDCRANLDGGGSKG